MEGKTVNNEVKKLMVEDLALARGLNLGGVRLSKLGGEEG